MTDKKISELNAMIASEIANDDEIVISDTSATHTKKSAISELSTFFGIIYLRLIIKRNLKEIF